MMIFFWLIIGFGLYYLYKNKGVVGISGEKSSLDTLKERYVNGEIDEEQYKRMSEVLKK